MPALSTIDLAMFTTFPRLHNSAIICASLNP